MAVQVGSKMVSEAAANFVRSQDFASATGSAKERSNAMMNELAQRYTSLNFFGPSKPSADAGRNNIAIAPNILRQMASDPEKRAEYEALIYDINELAKNDTGYTPMGDKIIASGYTIDENGVAGAWTISQSGDEAGAKSFMDEILERLEQKREERLAEQKLNEKRAHATQNGGLNLKV